uniref:Secreted protein n=1 Tax=Schizaphis graminum TaxID=13262 RepID=A0A2S2P9Q6_SCHGA
MLVFLFNAVAFLTHIFSFYYSQPIVGRCFCFLFCQCGTCARFMAHYTACLITLDTRCQTTTMTMILYVVWLKESVSRKTGDKIQQWVTYLYYCYVGTQKVLFRRFWLGENPLIGSALLLAFSSGPSITT